MKILIIRLSSIGDILLATPFIRQVRQKFPRAQIDFIIKKEFEELLTENPNIDRLISYNIRTGMSGLRKLRRQLGKNNYNYVFDLHNNFRSIYIRNGIKSKFKYVIKKDKFIQSLLVYLKINKYESILPIPERYLKVGKFAGVEDDGMGPELFWNDEVKRFILKLIENYNLEADNFFTIAPGAGFYSKRWPIEYFKELTSQLINTYHKKIVILGSSAETKEGSELSKIKDVIDLTGQLTLLQTAVVLSLGKGLISNDTGLMHMATTVNIPVLAIFGSTVEEFGFFPFRSKSIVVENKTVNCRPCSHIGRNRCPQKHFRCMKELYPNLVYDKFIRLLKS